MGARGDRRWILTLTDPSILANPAVVDWMNIARSAGVPSRYLPSHRPSWYIVESIPPPQAILAPMGQKRMRVVLNSACAVPTNTLYAIYIPSGDELAPRLVRWLNSSSGQAALFANARAYGSGLYKLEPRDVLKVQVPARLVQED
jgi:hypothetical protein